MRPSDRIYTASQEVKPSDRRPVGDCVPVETEFHQLTSRDDAVLAPHQSPQLG
jgi:hypothetical protein